jgi:hypothetical protein
MAKVVKASKAEGFVPNNYTALQAMWAYVVVTLVSAIVIYVANMIMPDQVVLGTMSLSPWWALMLSAGKLGLLVTVASVLFAEWDDRRRKMMTPMQQIGAYFVVNVAALWLISRFAEVYGLGLSSWVVVAVLAAVIDFLQGFAVMASMKMMSLK